MAVNVSNNKSIATYKYTFLYFLVTVHTPGSRTLHFLNKDRSGLSYAFAFRQHRRENKRQKEIAQMKCLCTENVTYNEETTSKKSFK